MTELENLLSDRGLADEDVTFIVDYVEHHQAGMAREQAAQLIKLIFLRIGRDSPAGMALRRALGFSGGASLARAAKDFCVSKQYLHDLQSELAKDLGNLAFRPVEAPVAPPVAPAPARKIAGPSRR